MIGKQLFWTVMLVVNVVTYFMVPNPFSVLGGVAATVLIVVNAPVRDEEL